MAKKRLANKRKLSKLTVKVDLSKWDSGDWPLNLFEALQVERSEYSAEVRFNLDWKIFKKVSLDIAARAIESFFGSAVYACATTEGIEIRSEGETPEPVLLPWKGLVIEDGEALARVRAWADEWEKEMQEA